MAITTRDGYIAAEAAGQLVKLGKTASRTAVAATWFSVFDQAGSPGAGVLAGTSVAAGVVPTDATAGCPTIDAFAGGATGYLNRVDFGNTVACRMALYDMVWKGGAYAFNAAQALTGQPSYVGRMPGSSYLGTEIWLECVTAFTGLQSIRVQYLDEGGAAGDTGTIATGVAPIVGRMLQLPLAAGDNGVSQITNVTSTIATVGTFNVLVLRRLWSGRCRLANDGDIHGPDKINLVKLFADSALTLLVAPDSTATGIPELYAHVING